MLHGSLDGLKRLLVVGAHPDDIEIGCGGTILRLLSEYDLDVFWLVLGATESRRQEGIVGADRFLTGANSKQVVIESFRDSFFPGSYVELKEYFSKIREQFQADLILTHHLDDRHQDHRLVSELTWNTFRDHLIFEYEIPKYEGDLGRPNLYVPLSEEQCAQKVKAIVESFPSQSGKPWFSEDAFLALPRVRGVEAGRGTRYAEAFYCRKLTI